MTGVPGQEAPEGDLSENELKFVEQLYGDPVIPECPVCGSPRAWSSIAMPDTTRSGPARSRFRQRRHADRDVMRLLAEVRRRRQEERGFAGDAPVVDPRQAALPFDLGGVP